MRLIKNIDQFKGYYNIDTKQFCSFENHQKTIGIYKIIKSILTGLLVEDGLLYFLFGEEKFLITESHQVLIEVKSNTENKFSLINENDVLVEFLYLKPSTEFYCSPFEYIDEDDWGDFIANFINDKDQQRNYIMNKMKNC
jgi:hypothetical protein